MKEDKMSGRKKVMAGRLGWHTSIREMPHASGFSYPVFEWSYGFRDGMRGGELRAWPLQGALVFQDRREVSGVSDIKFNSVEEALKYLEEEYAWGEPPHIREVFQDALGTKKKFPVHSKEEAEQIFAELRKKWNALIA